MIVLGLMLLTGSVQAQTVNRIVAVVNDDVITSADVTAYLGALQAASQDPPSETDPTQRRRLAVNQLIEQRLILQEAQRAGVPAEPDEVLERYLAFRDRFGSDEQFRKSLAETGLTEEQLKRRIRDHIVARRAIDVRVRATVNVSPQEVATIIAQHPELATPGDRVRLRHLLIRVNDTRSAAEAEQLARQVRERLVAGEPFADLAKAFSEDDHRAEGGAMGWVAPGELMPALNEALTDLPIGSISPPVQTRLGFHLLQVEERRPVSELSLMEAHQAVQQRLYQQKFNTALAQWVLELKRKAYIEISGDP